jgi:hypothetical protein
MVPAGATFLQCLVYNPITDESFWAERGKGAWLGNRRLRVSARRQLNEALIATGTPYKGHGDFEEWAKIFAPLGLRCQAFGVSVRQALTSLGWPQAAMMVSGKAACLLGIPLPDACSCAKQVAL